MSDFRPASRAQRGVASCREDFRNGPHPFRGEFRDEPRGAALATAPNHPIQREVHNDVREMYAEMAVPPRSLTPTSYPTTAPSQPYDWGPRNERGDDRHRWR